jgi:hypothetical protein
MSDTKLVIAGLITPFSARGLSQTLEPISQTPWLRRTVNGALVDLSVPAFRKYATTITCEDQAVPALNGVWPGQQVTVDCVVELAYPTSGGTPDRPVVSGSSRVVGSHTYYRPRLTMRVVEYRTSFDEWGAAVGWSLRLEET